MAAADVKNPNPWINKNSRRNSMKPTRTWILIANAEIARIVENSGPGKGIHQVKDKVFEAPEQNQYSDQEGRTFNSSSHVRHKMETPNAGQQGSKEFVSEILDALQVSFIAGEFDRLIICAAPKTLGLIQKQIPNGLQSLEIEKIDQALPGHKTFPTDMSVLLSQVFEEFLLQFGGGAEICVTALRGKRNVLLAVIKKSGLSEAGARCNNRLVTRVAVSTVLKAHKLCILQTGNTPGQCLKVIKQKYLMCAKLIDQLLRGDLPGQVGDAADTLFDGSGYAKGSSFRSGRGCIVLNDCL